MSGNAPSSTSKTPRSAPSVSSSVEATPETRFAPELLCASRIRGERIPATSEAVVVLPFVAETTAVPSGSRAASVDTAPGSIVASTLPGRVVPPPCPARRERRPASLATAISSASRIRLSLEGASGRPQTALEVPTTLLASLCRTLSTFWFGLRRSLQTDQNAIFYLPVPRKRQFRAITTIDPAELAEFQSGLRRRYSDEEILEELRASSARLGRSPTMKEFADDPETRVHPQTVIEHFGSWNKAKRQAGLVPRRNATRAELIGQLQELGKRLGRVPTAKDVDANRGWMPSKSLYWHTFGSLTNALREAGFDVPVGEERLERAIEQGAAMARRLGHLPKFNNWADARRSDPSLLTEWQVYRMFDARRGAWSTFQFLVRQRLREEGVEVGRDGSLGAG